MFFYDPCILKDVQVLLHVSVAERVRGAPF
jgi:hypothetical protein